MKKCLPHEKKNCLLHEDKPDLRLVRTNYCVPGVMSRCSAGEIWHDQKRCKFADKSTVQNRCMYYIETIGGHCDCVDAQREMKNIAEKGRG